ncbi:MAG: helix-turn-helix domain-containing protein [Candidatus Dormibacteraeota bacterium]|nr:helix-turn-helix domain-containing protein [Candidatus Dormibacteraeota bacterium]MDQ6900783.1 helix-turn-helix domain-containing protein [Candidatus Dormibacteraeota bacterium]
MRKNQELTSALYVRLPEPAADKLARAAEVLSIPKKDLVTSLVSRYVDPDSRDGLEALGALMEPRRVTVELGEPAVKVGHYAFHPYEQEQPEVMTPEQAGQLLQLPVPVVLELAESGELPGRRLGGEWRFSRTALVEWVRGSEADARSSAAGPS